MASTTRLPSSLIAVAAMLVAWGIWGVISTAIAFTSHTGQTRINLAIIGPFIAFGLVRLRRGWRTCALVFAWLIVVSAPVSFVTERGDPSILTFHFLGSLFILCVLLRGDIKARFGLNVRPSDRESPQPN